MYMKVWVSVDVYTCQPPVLIKNIYYELFRKNQVITMQTPSDKKIYKEKKELSSNGWTYKDDCTHADYGPLHLSMVIIFLASMIIFLKFSVSASIYILMEQNKIACMIYLVS